MDNGKILTSAGAAAGLDLCLHIVRRDFGAEVAARTARLAVMPLERAGGQAQFIVHDAPTVNDKTAMGTLLLWIEKNLHKELSLPVIARHAAMSPRTLSRRLQSESAQRRPTGLLPRVSAEHSNSWKQRVCPLRR